MTGTGVLLREAADWHSIAVLWTRNNYSRYGMCTVRRYVLWSASPQPSRSIGVACSEATAGGVLRASLGHSGGGLRRGDDKCITGSQVVGLYVSLKRTSHLASHLLH